MQKMNELFGKRVINQLTGNQVAIVREVVLDSAARQILALILTSEHSREEQVVRMENVLGMGEFVVIDGARPLQSSAGDSEIVALRKSAQQITGKKLMSVTGDHVGTVGDMHVGRNGIIVGFELKHGMFSSTDPQAFRAVDVQTVGADAVIVNTPHPIALSLLAAEVDSVEVRHVDSFANDRAERVA
ncbi:MAG: hypothetical protein EI684_17640 [Candidatus Viridilinea halotolerans]|uniref:PRC-barrel domain-containing protein n=1 Tax=Candidatus Viridilinea halotolerans TaxID=2491704 RepID=A0A426TTX4_9CHLR|nr:MAG: hypothetical protein EI684_17640 [Candidatus Viridilinea halotolerans]